MSAPMNLLRCTSLAAAAIASALAIAVGSAAGKPVSRPSSTSLLAGLNIAYDPTAPASQVAHELAVAQALHARLVRTTVPWYEFERAGPGAPNAARLATLDALVQAASADGIRVSLTVDGTPCWASSAPSSLLRRCAPGRPGAAAAWPPRNPSAYAQFVALLARRYGPRLAAIEIWNEPDEVGQYYFAGPEKPRRYAAIVRAAYTAIKRAEPAVTVLAGSLVGPNGVFLRELYAAGMKGYYDGLAVHFYTLTLASLHSIREVQLAAGDHTPLWLDEFGWPSCYPHRKLEQEQACVSQAVQATNISNTLRALGQVPYVAAAAVYKLQDSPAEEFGLLSGGGARKPAYASFARALAAPLGPVDPIRLRLRRSRSSIVASGSAPVGNFMQIEVLIAGAPRYRAVFTLDRFNDYSITLPAILGTSGLQVRVSGAWGIGPVAAQASI